MPLSPNCGRLLVCVFVLLLGYAGYSFSKSNAAIKEVAAEISAEGGIKVTRAPFPIALPGAMTQASSLAPQAPGHAAGESWPHNCPTGAILAAYPNSSAARTFHMSGIMDRIGACGKVVSAVMRDKVTTASENGFVTAVYEGEVIMRNKGKKLPTGNAPNAATHMRMIKEGANADGLEAHDWMLYFEDDAQLHANVREAFATPGEVQKLLKWSFMAANAMGANMISYAVCAVPGRSKCIPADLPELQKMYPDVQLGTCTGDFRCAVAYALRKSRAALLVEAYDQLNQGHPETCTARLWGSGDCSVDPMSLNNYFRKCAKKVKAEACKGLVVGMNLIAPTARHDDHLGIFIQEKNKDFIKHYKV